MTTTLEDLFTSSAHGFGVSTASPLQRAICRIIEGLPLDDLAAHPDVVKALGGEEAIELYVAGVRPLEVDILAAIRSGKTRLACAIAWRATQIVDVSALASGEVPRFSLLSLKVDGARAAYDQLVGTVLARKTMKGLLVEAPANDALVVWHPSGRPIEIVCVAGARAGGGLVARWSAGALFDEFTRMVGIDDGVVNFDDARRAVIGRLLPNAQIISAGSPWAPMGPAWERCNERHGKPTPEHVVIRGTGPMLNPVWWTPERCARLQKSDPTAYTTDVEGDFADPESSFITSTEITNATRKEPLVMPPVKGWRYAAAMDPGTRGNSWTLIVLGGYLDEEKAAHYAVVLADQWTGSPREPLSPSAVFQSIARLVRPYGVSTVATDQHAADANADIASRCGLSLAIMNVGATNRNALFERLKGLFETKAIELAPEPMLVRDVASVRRRLTQTGLSYHLPKTADGRHADYVPALTLAVNQFATSEGERAAAATRAKVERFEHTWDLAGHAGHQAQLLAELREQERGGGSLWTRVARAQALSKEGN